MAPTTRNLKCFALGMFVGLAGCTSERDRAADAALAVETAKRQADEALAVVVRSAEAAAGSGSFEDARAFAEASAGYAEDPDSAAVTRAFGDDTGRFWEAVRTAADALDAYEAAFAGGGGGLREDVDRQRGVVATAERMMAEIDDGREKLDEMTVSVRRAFDTDPETGQQMYEALDVGTGRAVVLLAAPGTIRPGWSGRTLSEYAGQRQIAVAFASGRETEWREVTFPAYAVETELDEVRVALVRAQLNGVRNDLRASEEALAALEARHQGPFVEAALAVAEQVRALGGAGVGPESGP